MSLINEALYNLDNKKDEDLINPSTKFKKMEQKQSAKPVQNFLILFISFGIIVALLYITYTSQLNQYFSSVKGYITHHTNKLVSNASGLKNKLTTVDKPVISKDISTSKEYPAKIQEQYYTAMNFLNEGNIEQARKSLSKILEENPEFVPAKQAISMLDGRP